MNYNLHQATQILERTPAVLEAMLQGLDDAWIYSNEGGDTWTAFDVVGHLVHGEKSDWMARTKKILEEGDKRFAPFDRFAQFTESKGKTLQQLLEEFRLLRSKNLQELHSLGLTETDLDKTGIHPKFGAVTLRQLLATWTVHDLTHIHQLSRILAKQYQDAVGPWFEFLGVLNRG